MTIPSLNDLYTSIQADLKNNLNITSSLVGKTVLNAFAMVQAAKMKLFYLLIAFIYDQIFVDTAVSEDKGGTLERFGLVKLGRTRNPATAGEYKINVIGEIGAIIPAGTSLKSLDLSTSPDKIFVIDSEVTLGDTEQEVQIRALDLGSEARLTVADQLQFVAPIANVDSFTVVTEVVITPTDRESLEDYRDKIINAFRTEPQGGSRGDYRIWSEDANGVRAVYPYAADGAAFEVDLFIEANASDSSDGNGTPTAAIISDVEDVVKFDPDTSKPLNERGRRPVGVIVNFLPVNPLAVDIEIESLSDTSFLIEIKNAIKEFLLNVRPYVDGADPVSESGKGKLFKIDITTIIRDVIGGNNTFSDIVMKIDSTSYNSYEFENGDIPYINSVTAV